MTKPLHSVKIFCKTEAESAKIQRLLQKEIGATWGMESVTIPWNTCRNCLIVCYWTYSNRWCIHWMSNREFFEDAGRVYYVPELIAGYKAMKKSEMQSVA